ncbi:hypothetical protein NE865_04504 [Phthorimaea operculella]|nr:hypothetical protein NE865_04504 [Phthorimaea operculella]
MPNCGSCQKQIVYSGESLPCKKCKIIFHYACLNITSAAFRENRQELLNSYICDQCSSVDAQHAKEKESSPVLVFQSPFTDKHDDSLMSCDGSGHDDTKLNVNMAPRKRHDAGNIDSNTSFEPSGQSSPEKVTIDGANAVQKASASEIPSASMLKLQEMFSTLNSSITALNSSVMACHEEITAVRTDLIELKREVNKRCENNEEEIRQLNEEISVLRSEIEHRDRMQLMNNVEISGVTENGGENLHQIITVLATKLGVSLDARDIDYVARAGKRHLPAEGEQAPRPRPIIVRFVRRAPRDELLRAARTRRNLSTDLIEVPGERRPIYLNEHLTKSDRQLYGKTRSIARELNFKFVWKKNGRIFIKKNEHGDT